MGEHAAPSTPAKYKKDRWRGTDNGCVEQETEQEYPDWLGRSPIFLNNLKPLVNEKSQSTEGPSAHPKTTGIFVSTEWTPFRSSSRRGI